MRKILVNKIRCKKCGDVIESKSVHGFKFEICRASNQVSSYKRKLF